MSFAASGAPRIGRRHLLQLGAALACLLRLRPVHAEDVALPITLQADLLVKIATYDRNLPARAGEQVLVLVLVRRGDGDSVRAANQLRARLEEVPRIAGLPRRVELVEYVDAAKLSAAVRSRRTAILYVTPGFADVIAALGTALEGLDVLTLGAVPGYVEAGTVLSFDVVSGKPKLAVHLGRARRQNVAFDASFLKLVKLVER